MTIAARELRSLLNLALANNGSASDAALLAVFHQSAAVSGQTPLDMYVDGATTLAGSETGYAASAVSVTDAATRFEGTNVETCLAECSTLAEMAATTNGDGAALVGIEDAGAFTAAADVEAALAEIYQHIKTAQAHISIPLATLREATAFDVGDIAGIGGLLASDTTPVLSAINDATDGCQRVQWASSNNDQVIFQFAVPPDLDDTADLLLYTRIASGGTTDAVGFTVGTYFDEGDTAVADTSATNQTTTYANALTTIAAADVPAGAKTCTVGLTPVAHTSDAMNLTGIWLLYKRKILTS
jgi:hypothetical protein